MDYLPLTAQDS